MSTVNTGTLLFQANNEWHKMIQHDTAIWHSQDMAFTNMKTTIYKIIQDFSRIENLHNLRLLNTEQPILEFSCH